ncbi:hypothetical protein FA95DRAFT_688789 [Auriscalpium vulgare]|uniref:Uncharacterized protein n=1 Tax=Auriscalpium vulgare TaxID=40419 RepID=A0ACB8S2U9_9AGAM|nr:hypothetical protein FA95DRAFT_688789 [Auriscalpium vulgare]
MFRLHKEALAENMEFFESLFEMPHGGDNVDGAPMLEVGETAVQWALICVLLYTPQEFGATPVLYSDIATLLDFSSRFQCIHFREAAVSLLSTFLPTRLENYLQRRRLCKVVGPQHLHAHVHALLLTHKIPELLPLARFQIACSSLEQLFNGWTDASTGETLRLPRSELARVLRGRDEVLRVRRDIALSCLRLHMLFRYDFRFTTNCTARRTPLDNDCSIALTDVVTEMRKAADTVYAPRLALAPLDRATRERLRKLLCGNCRAALRSRMARGQRHIWMCLPQMFGMGDWFEVERHGATVRKLEFQWAMKKEFGDEEEQGYYDEEAYDEENGQGNDADGGQEGEEAFGDAGEAAPEGTGQEHEDEWGRDDWSASGDSDSTAQYTDDTEFAEFDGPMDLGPGPGNTTFPEGFRWPIEEWTHEYPEPEPHPWQDEGSAPEWEVLPEESRLLDDGQCAFLITTSQTELLQRLNNLRSIPNPKYRKVSPTLFHPRGILCIYA